MEAVQGTDLRLAHPLPILAISSCHLAPESTCCVSIAKAASLHSCMVLGLGWALCRRVLDQSSRSLASWSLQQQIFSCPRAEPPRTACLTACSPFWAAMATHGQPGIEPPTFDCDRSLHSTSVGEHKRDHRLSIRHTEHSDACGAPQIPKETDAINTSRDTAGTIRLQMPARPTRR
jgi:hypothetical protein